MIQQEVFIDKKPFQTTNGILNFEEPRQNEMESCGGDDEPEPTEPDNENMDEIDEAIRAIAENGVIDNYLEAIKKKTKGRKGAERICRGYFLGSKKKALHYCRKAKQCGETSLAYSFLVVSTSFKKGYEMPCLRLQKIDFKGFNIKPRARRIIDQMISLLDGMVLKDDHSFKSIDHMAKVNGVSTFSYLYILLNDLPPQCLEMMENYRRFGMKLSEIFYTDNLVGDQRFLKEVIPSLDKEFVTIAQSNKKNFAEDMIYLLKEVMLPDDAFIIVCDDCRSIGEVYQMLQDELSIQVTLSEDVCNIACNMQGDFTMLARSFQSLVSQGEEIKLSQLCAIVLMLLLPKTPTIRCGNWEPVNLFGKKQKYAALDAWVSLAIYHRTKNLPRVNQKINQKSSIGIFISMYAKFSKKIVGSGYGYICDPSEVEDDKASNLNENDLISIKIEIRCGHVSDVKNGPLLYTELGYDTKNPMRYRHSRGTSSVEGSVHMNIVRKFASYNAGPRLTDMVLADYILYHNFNVRMIYSCQYVTYYICNLGNSFDCLPLKESFGIAALPDDLMKTYNISQKKQSSTPQDLMSLKLAVQMSILPIAMLPTVGYFDDSFLYAFLTERQNTNIAISAKFKSGA
ncbi:hypothetical protein [Parasitella parasitica]|uniref:Uncharacterized protein n=1 Tax=Parasitella parasitica TaxID=35722 RepID=A0A0B7NE25_9FUNG|nr:hypothetical protein [Parasitella parasitica]